jgi:phage tail-like protein
VFHGAAARGPQSAKTFSAKLFDVKERYLWVFITLTAASGARLPLLSELVVYYPGRTLMEDLPAIYQKEEDRPDNFLRALVGVLESTTQGLDARIASMGRQIHPETAQELWLNFIARWLGVPWDDALTVEQKRSIVKRAPDLAKGRGTRAGLEALLDSLIPGPPRRFRVTDVTADHGFAVVGGESCVGSALPAMLGGRTRWQPELGSSAVLGSIRLPCAGQLDDGVWQIAGKIRVEVAATATERAAWEPWLLALITELVPLTVRVQLRWVTSQALRTNRLDGTMTLESAPAPHLGTDAITGLARLPEHGARISAAGPTIGTRLR